MGTSLDAIGTVDGMEHDTGTRMDVYGELDALGEMVAIAIDGLCVHVSPQGNEREGSWSCCYCLAKSTLRRRLLRLLQRQWDTELAAYASESLERAVGQ